MKIPFYTFIKVILALSGLGVTAARAQADTNSVEVFRCSLVVQDHVLHRRNPLLLEIKDREVKLKKTQSANDLQVIFAEDELSETVRGSLQIMGTVVSQDNRSQLKLGFYSLQTRYLKYIDPNSFWIAPATSNSSSYYAHPLTESIVRFKPTETYNLDLKSYPRSGFSIGSYEKANHVGLECVHVRSE